MGGQSRLILVDIAETAVDDIFVDARIGKPPNLGDRCPGRCWFGRHGDDIGSMSACDSKEF